MLSLSKTTRLAVLLLLLLLLRGCGPPPEDAPLWLPEQEEADRAVKLLRAEKSTRRYCVSCKDAGFLTVSIGRVEMERDAFGDAGWCISLNNDGCEWVGNLYLERGSRWRNLGYIFGYRPLVEGKPVAEYLPRDLPERFLITPASTLTCEFEATGRAESLEIGEKDGRIVAVHYQSWYGDLSGGPGFLCLVDADVNDGRLRWATRGAVAEVVLPGEAAQAPDETMTITKTDGSFIVDLRGLSSLGRCGAGAEIVDEITLVKGNPRCAVVDNR